MRTPNIVQDFIAVAIKSWNPDNFEDLITLLKLQYGDRNIKNILTKSTNQEMR